MKINIQRNNCSQGLAIIYYNTAIENATNLGKEANKSARNDPRRKTPLELQINSFVKKMVIIGVVVFFIVWHKLFNSYSLFLIV